MSTFEHDIQTALKFDCGKEIGGASTGELYRAVSRAAMRRVRGKWEKPVMGKRACYFSAEFLIGRVVYSNLLNLGLLERFSELFRENGVDPNLFEEIEDAALGNGGLGRLAACFLDSAATHRIPLDGYGIRYRYGLFRQYFENGFQREADDDWQRFGDPWSVRREDESVLVRFKDQTVRAVPYDMPVVGYGNGSVNTLRLWQAEPVSAFDFALFNEQKYNLAVREREEAERITAVLYPNDDTDKGKRLRLKQQYFFTSASLQDLLRAYKQKYGSDFSRFPDEYAIQLNDTHPVVSIPELIRLLLAQGVPFRKALALARRTFAYTNHTVMTEALETWDVRLFRSVLPEISRLIHRIDGELRRELEARGVSGEAQAPYRIVDGGRVHMARLAVFATHSTNGVARIHTELLKNKVLRPWYELYPARFSGITNGVTQRRWLALANPELSRLITERIGPGWVKDLKKLRELEKWKDDRETLRAFEQVKRVKKRQLAEYVKKREGIEIDPDFIFDIQAKRLHEYKRQLLNAFSILDFYFGIKSGRIRNFYPTVFLFAGKAAPGYFRAKGIIKFISEIAGLVNGDAEVGGRMRVVFLTNYDVSYAEKLMPAADISEQISTAGTEASGTGNMKFMLNGAVTLGTHDGANLEIAEQAGAENNYLFGARVEELEKIRESYSPRTLFLQNPRIKTAVGTLQSGMFSDGGTGMFRELYTSLLDGASWHRADHYFLLYDFISYCEERLRANADYADRAAFTQKCFLNTAHAGMFSSDRAVAEYAAQIWGI